MIRLQTTPKTISKEINEFCKEIDETQKPYHVQVSPEPASIIKKCFLNVKNKVEKDGGNTQFGWEIWEWPNLMLEAVFHAIWVSPENECIDITPKEWNDKEILFLPDSTLKYDFSSDYYRVAGRYKPLCDNPFVTKFIELSKQNFEVEERLFPGRQINPENPAFELLKELREKRVSIYLQLVSQSQPQSDYGKPGRNAPCPCGSGRKFKKCCGKQ